MQQAKKRPNKHRSNNTTAGITEWHSRNGSKIMEGAMSGLKKEKSTIKQGPAFERSKAINQKIVHAIRDQG